MYSDNNKSQGSVDTHLRCGGLASLQSNYRSLLVKKILKLVHFWWSYRQNGLIASHALFEVHCPGERCRFRWITCIWWTTAVIHCCYFKKRVIVLSFKKITTVNNSWCPSYASYPAKSAPFTRTVHFQQGMWSNQTILPVTLPKVYQFWNFFSPANRTITTL